MNTQRKKIADKLALLPYQSLFFSSINYLPLKHMDGQKSDINIDDKTTVFLLTGIANPAPLVAQVKKQTSHLTHHNYPDHYNFSLKNIAKLADDFNACRSQKKMIITTEKDAQRLAKDELRPLVDKLPIFIQPIGVSFFTTSTDV